MRHLLYMTPQKEQDKSGCLGRGEPLQGAGSGHGTQTFAHPSSTLWDQPAHPRPATLATETLQDGVREKVIKIFHKPPEAAKRPRTG